MPREPLPIVNLEQVEELIESSDPSDKLINVYGIFKKETLYPQHHWTLFDESKEIHIRLAGAASEYPRPKPGDVVRIHRLRVNSRNKISEVPLAKNVVIWPAFQHEPKPNSVARNPTINEDDQKRRRILEAYFCTRVTKLSDLVTSRQLDTFCDAVAGRFESSKFDQFRHIEIEFTDGTATMILRVFCKDKDFEDDTHYNLAKELQKGQYFVATNVKFSNGRKLNLSANLSHGRALRLVDTSSILGIKLKEKIEMTLSQKPQAQASETSQPRKSPRLLQQNQDDNRPQEQITEELQEENEDTATANGQPVVSTPTHPLRSQRVYPEFTPYSEIQKKAYGYDFYNLVGQVRDNPRLTQNFGNCIIQIFDGSMHEFSNFHSFEVEHLLDGCLILCVYSKQKDSDTNEHLEKASSLKEGDIIYITNVKVSFVAGKIKAELSANKSHNKSIKVIDKRTSFGKMILSMAETPQVDELREFIDPVQDSDCEPFSA